MDNGHRRLIAMFETMVRIRRFEAAVQRLFYRNLLSGPVHLATGQEAVAAGVAAVRRTGDMMFCTYRGHGHVLAWGATPLGVMRELMGRAGGLCAAKGGSMHLAAIEQGLMGSYAIVGAHLPIANGAAWAAQIRGSDSVTVCFFGDGATNIGAFHEALNQAAVWRLPVVFVCENNQYMEYTDIRQVTAVARPAYDRATAYALPALLVDGNDVQAVHGAAEEAFDRARAGEGPTVIEAETYRHSGHALGDPAPYRPSGELEGWQERDPIDRARASMLELGSAEQELAGIEDRAESEVAAAVAEAEQSPPPDAADLWTHVWSDGGWQWRN